MKMVETVKCTVLVLVRGYWAITLVRYVVCIPAVCCRQQTPAANWPNSLRPDNQIISPVCWTSLSQQIPTVITVLSTYSTRNHCTAYLSTCTRTASTRTVVRTSTVRVQYVQYVLSTCTVRTSTYVPVLSTRTESTQ